MPLRPVIVSVTYLALWTGLGALGLATTPALGISPWYPDHALSLALIAVFGPRYLPLLLVARLLAAGFLVSEPLPMTLAAACAIAASYGAAGWILHARRADLRLGTMRAAGGFLAAGIGASAVLPVLVVVAKVLIGVGAVPEIVHHAIVCGIGDALAIVGLGPLVLRGAVLGADLLGDRRADPPPDAERFPAGSIALLAVVTVGAIAFSSRRWDVFGAAPVYLVAIPVIWAAFVSGSGAAAIVVAAVNLGVPLVQQGAGAGAPVQDIQLLLGVVSVMGLLLGAATTERRRHTAELGEKRAALERSVAATRRLGETQSTLERAESIAGIGSYCSDHRTGEVWWSEQLFRMLRCDPAVHKPGAELLAELVYPDDREGMLEVLRRVRDGRQPPGPLLNTVRVVRGDGVLRHMRLSREIAYGADGKINQITGIVEDVTDEVETRRALAETEERLGAVAANVPGVVFRYVQRPINGRGAFTFVSDGVQGVFGIDPNALVLRPELLFDRIHPNDRDIVFGALRESARALTPWEVVFRVAGAERELWVHGAAQTRRAPNGYVMWDGLLLDVTAEKTVERELRASEERFRFLTALAPMALVLIGRRDGRIRYANQACERMFGYRAGRMEGMRLARVLADPGSARRMRRELTEVGSIMQREIALRREDGSRFDGLFSLMLTGMPGSEESDEIVACGLDASELKDARDALARQSHDLEVRVRELHCRYVMSRLTHDLGRSVGAICRDIVDVLPQGWPAADQLWVRLTVRGETYVSGRPRSAPPFAQARIMAGSEHVGDIELGAHDGRFALPPHTEEERDLLGSAARQIGHMIFEREATARLVQAQRLEGIGQLSGGIAHDFSNLLTVVLGNLELAEERAQTDVDLTRCLSTAQQAARRAAELTGQLLAFSRRQALIPELLELNELVSRILASFRRTLGEGIEVVTELSAKPARVRVDRAQMEAAVLHFAVNARDAMTGGGRLTLATREIEIGPDDLPDWDGEEAEPGRYVELAISDSGGGMPPEVVGRVFDPFFTTKEVRRGSGLGLSAVFGFVKQSGGFLTVASEVGRGTTFRICLPVAAHGIAAAADGAGQRSDSAHEGACILVVEDEPRVLDYVARCLRLAGFRTLTASNAREALDLLEGGYLPDLLLTDVGLPGDMDGPALARAARERNPALKVLYASGYAYETLVASGAIGGDVPVILKPFVRPDLLARVRAALDGDPVSSPGRPGRGAAPRANA